MWTFATVVGRPRPLEEPETQEATPSGMASEGLGPFERPYLRLVRD